MPDEVEDDICDAGGGYDISKGVAEPVTGGRLRRWVRFFHRWLLGPLTGRRLLFPGDDNNVRPAPGVSKQLLNHI